MSIEEMFVKDEISYDDYVKAKKTMKSLSNNDYEMMEKLLKLPKPAGKKATIKISKSQPDDIMKVLPLETGDIGLILKEVDKMKTAKSRKKVGIQ